MSARLLALPAAAVAALLTGVPVAAGAPASARTHTKVVSDCQHARYEPRRIILTCGDANSGLTRLRYDSWTASRAHGEGRFVYDDCDPTCAAGHDHHFHVTVTLKRVRGSAGHRVFTRLVTHHHGKRQTYVLPTTSSS